MHNEDELIRQIHAEAASLLKKKRSDEIVIQHIVSRGFTRHYAENVLDNVKNDSHDRNGFTKSLLAGIAVLVSGVLLNIASYSFAVKGGLLVYYVFWGIIVAGISMIARAFIIFRK